MRLVFQIALQILSKLRICSFGKTDDDPIKVETCRLKNILCSKLLCLIGFIPFMRYDEANSCFSQFCERTQTSSQSPRCV